MLRRPWSVGDSGRLLADFSGRFEQLEPVFRQGCSRLELGARLGHVRSSSRGSDRHNYPEATAALVVEVITECPVAFGYDF